jgi:hypothetical protein
MGIRMTKWGLLARNHTDLTRIEGYTHAPRPIQQIAYTRFVPRDQDF